LKILLHHIIRVHWSEKQYLEISTARGRCQIGIADNAYYRNWRPSLKFVTARRLAFEIRLRISSAWSDEDNQEAEFFVGDIPAADRAEDDTNSRLAAIYGSILYEGSVQQYIARQTLWRTTKHHWETQSLVLRESALLLHKGRPMVRFNTHIPFHSLIWSSVNVPAVRPRSMYQFARGQGCDLVAGSTHLSAHPHWNQIFSVIF
jgi:hypothetical protein